MGKPLVCPTKAAKSQGKTQPEGNNFSVKLNHNRNYTEKPGNLSKVICKITYFLVFFDVIVMTAPIKTVNLLVFCFFLLLCEDLQF